MSDWYVQQDQEVVGPMSAAQLKELVSDGRISADTLIRKQSMKKFVPAVKIKGLLRSTKAVHPVESPAPNATVTASHTSRFTITKVVAGLLLLIGGIAGGTLLIRNSGAETDGFASGKTTPAGDSELAVPPAGADDRTMEVAAQNSQQKATVGSKPPPIVPVSEANSTVAAPTSRTHVDNEAGAFATRTSREAWVLIETSMKDLLARDKPAPKPKSASVDPETVHPPETDAALAPPAGKPAEVGFTVEEQERWLPVIEQASKTTDFNPLLMGGVPVIGSGSYSLMDREQRMNSKRSALQIDWLLTWLAMMSNPRVSAEVERRLESTSSDNADNASQLDFNFFAKCLDYFGSQEEYNEFVELRRSELNQFDKADRMLETYRQTYERMKALAKPLKAPVPLCFLEPVTLGTYDAERSAFRLEGAGRTTVRKIAGLGHRLDLLIVPAVEPLDELHVPLEKAKELARSAEGKELMIKSDVRLTRFRRNKTGDFSITDEILSNPIGNVQIIGFSLIAVDNPSTPLHTWEPGTGEERLTETSGFGDDPESEVPADELSRKMLRLAKEHNLTLRRGYPAINSDQSKFDPAYDRRFRALLDRVLLGLDPTIVDPDFVVTHFPETIGQFVIPRMDGQGRIFKDHRGSASGSRWAGEDQFTQRAAKDAFFKQYQQKIEDYAVELPIRYTEVFTAQLAMGTVGEYANYDFERKGILLQISQNTLRPPVPLSQSQGEWRPHERPTVFDPFLSIDPQTAQACFFGPNEDGQRIWPVMARTVTLGALDLDAPDNPSAKVAISWDSLGVYRTPQLKDKLGDLKLWQFPAPVLAVTEEPVLPGPHQPIVLDNFTLLSLLAEATGKPVPADLLKDQFQRYRYDESGPGDLSRALLQAEKEVYEFGIERRYEPQGTRQEAEAKLRKTRAKIERMFAESTSSFWPSGHDDSRQLSPELESRLTARWLEWLRQRLLSTDRYVVLHGEIQVDPDVGDVVLAFQPGTPLNPSSWDVSEKLLTQGIPEDRIVPLSDLYKCTDYGQLQVEPLPRLGDGQGVSVCLVLNKALTALGDAVPKMVRQQILARPGGHNAARVEFIMQLGDSSYERGERTDGLIIHGDPVGVRIYNNESLVIEGRFEAVDPDTAPNGHPSTPKRGAGQPSASGGPQPVEQLTPAAMTWLLAKTIPEALTTSAPQLLLRRWEHEHDFRRNRERSQLGVRPERGMYFRQNADKPTPQQLLAGAGEFASWLRERSGRVTNRFTITRSMQFGSLDPSVDGYRRTDGRRTKIDIENARRKIERVMKAEQSMQQFDRSSQERRKQQGGGGFALTPGSGSESTSGGGRSTPVRDQRGEKIKALEQELRELEVYAQNYRIASPFIDLSDEDGEFVVEDLEGRRRLQNQSNQIISGQWQPNQEASKVGEPMHPWLRLDRDIMLPQSLGIEPGQQRFKVSIVFDVSGGRLDDARPLPVDPDTVGPFARFLVPKDANDELAMGDFGQYAILDVRVVKATLLDPSTGKPLHELQVVDLAQPQPVH